MNKKHKSVGAVANFNSQSKHLGAYAWGRAGFRLTLIAASIAACSTAWAADTTNTSTLGDATLDFNNSGLQVTDNIGGSLIGLDPAQNQIGILDGVTGRTVILNTDASIFDGSLSVHEGLSVDNGLGGNALTVTGNSSLTGALNVTGDATLNSAGTNTISADSVSARMQSGLNNVTVDSAKVGLAFSDGAVSSSILMQNPGGATPGGVAILATGAVGSGVEASVLVNNGAVVNGLAVRANETILSGGETSSTSITLNDTGFKVTGASGDTFSVSNSGVSRIGNDALAGSLAISNGTPSGNSVLLNGVNNTITGTTSTAISGGTSTLTLSNAGATFNNQQIHGVAAGVANTDAVNVGQLTSLSSNNTARFNAMDSRIDSVSERAYAGIASVAALAAIPSPAVGKTYSVGLGVGTYSGENAFAVGFRGVVSETVSVTLGVSQNSATKTAANAGVGFSW
ncbi:MAG: YadA-like family protein [Pseudomonadota bacterium]